MPSERRCAGNTPSAFSFFVLLAVEFWREYFFELHGIEATVILLVVFGVTS